MVALQWISAGIFGFLSKKERNGKIEEKGNEFEEEGKRNERKEEKEDDFEEEERKGKRKKIWMD